MINLGIKNKVALITGSTRGIGLASAQLLADCGSKVFLNGINADRIQATVNKFRNYGYEVDGLVADITIPEQGENLVKKAVEAWGTVDILVNNVGTTRLIKTSELEIENWEQEMKSNLYSTFFTIKEAMKYMKENKNGKIVNISSISGLRGKIDGVHYAAVKSALVGMTKSLARELGPFNVQVNAIAPGLTNTNLSHSIYSGDFFEQVRNNTPLKRIAEPIDIAKMVLVASSSLCDFVTGSVFSVDGGFDI